MFLMNLLRTNPKHLLQYIFHLRRVQLRCRRLLAERLFYSFPPPPPYERMLYAH